MEKMVCSIEAFKNAIKGLNIVIDSCDRKRRSMKHKSEISLLLENFLLNRDGLTLSPVRALELRSEILELMINELSLIYELSALRNGSTPDTRDLKEKARDAIFSMHPEF